MRQPEPCDVMLRVGRGLTPSFITWLQGSPGPVPAQLLSDNAAKARHTQVAVQQGGGTYSVVRHSSRAGTSLYLYHQVPWPGGDLPIGGTAQVPRGSAPTARRWPSSGRATSEGPRAARETRRNLIPCRGETRGDWVLICMAAVPNPLPNFHPRFRSSS